MTDDFPAELVERCRKEGMARIDGTAMIRAVLRVSGHAELVAALEAIANDPDTNIEAVVYARDALKSAGYLP